MIRQVSDVIHFENASSIVIPLKAPSAEQTHIVLAVTTTSGHPHTPALSVGDNLADPRRWRMANGDGQARAMWYRIGGPHGGVNELRIATAHALKITGTAVAAEVAAVAPGAAVQELCDLLSAA